MSTILDLVGGALGGIWGYIAGAVLAAGSFLGVYLKGRSDAKRSAALKDLRHAENIGDNVRANIAGELRKHDDSGWRD